MSILLKRLGRAVLAVGVLAMAAQVPAADIGRIKVARGQVVVERAGATLPGLVGTRVQASDTVRTGDDGAVGITMDDDSLLSGRAQLRAGAGTLRVRPDDQPGAPRRRAQQGDAGGHLGPHREAIAGRHDRAHAGGDSRRSRHVVRGQRE